jgi:hypothetical protein
LGIAALLRRALDYDGPARIARNATRRLQRNEQARLYHWKKHNRLPPRRIGKKE